MKNVSFLFLLIIHLSGFFTYAQKDSRILFIVSNQETYGSSDMKTANHFGEIIIAYDILINEGFKIDFVSPNGGKAPVGYIKKTDTLHFKYLNDKPFMASLNNTLKPDEVSPENYKAVYYSGGGAAMFGIPENTDLQKISQFIYSNGGVLSAVCHGTAGIVNLKDKQGNPIYKNKRITGFPDLFEKKQKPYYQTFPFSIEDKINQNQGHFQYSKKGWDGYFQIDGRIITGQDPTSVAPVALKIIEILNQNF